MDGTTLLGVDPSMARFEISMLSRLAIVECELAISLTTVHFL